MIGTALRGCVGVAGLFLGTALAGAGIALGNVLLPSLVKRDYSNVAALMTGLYTMFLVGGAAFGAAVTLPVARGLGISWEGGLSMWAALALLALFAWIPVALRAGGHGTRRRNVLAVHGLYTDGLAWAVTLFMGIQSALGYSVMGWMAPILQARGLSGTEAGVVTSMSILTQAGACLLAPLLIGRFREQRWPAVLLAVVVALAFAGIVVGPLGLVWPLAFILGLGQGGTFALALMLIVLRSRDSHVAAHLSSMSQTTGYILASMGPLLIGLLHQWTGSFRSSLFLIIAMGIGAALAGWYAGRSALVGAGTAESTPPATASSGR
ncbi:CP family cyanate transporter-like MFS transporter OS=Castellaniella defragrans OX=75697 GN=HNR28_002849 PE=4 SV=1 [Castellaniella defragrans]